MNTIRRANKSLIKNGVTEKSRKNYNGDINVRIQTKRGFVTKSFTNSDIKSAFEKARNVYAEII